MATDDLSTAGEKEFSAQFLQKRRRRLKRRVLVVLAVVAAGGGYYYWQLQQAPDVQEDEKLIVTIGYGDIENDIPATGSLQPKEVVPVGARASGQLEEILVEVGDKVEEGQLLARIDASEQKLRVESSELSLKNQENQLEQRQYAVEKAQNDFDRTAMLRDANASTQQEYETAKNNLINAKTNLENLRIQIEQSKTNLQQERVQLNYTEIKAPLSGTIISLDQKEGATLNASQTAPTVMQIADLSVMTVETDISEADVSNVKPGVDVYFTTLGSGDRRWYGNLRLIDPMAKTNSNVVTYTGRFDVDNSDGELYPGMTTQVFFVTSHAEHVLTVPLGALTFTDTPSQPNAGAVSSRQGQGADREELAARFEQFRQNGGEITPEMRQRIEQFRQNGGSFPGGGGRGGFSGGGGRRGGGSGSGGFGGGSAGSAAAPSLAGSIALNEPRHATVQLVRDDGSIVTREVVIGATDRVNAEVISGLAEGDRVVAGIVQPKVEEDEQQDNNRGRNDFRMRGGFRPF